MKFSEALENGSGQITRANCSIFYIDDNGNYKGCAFGGALIGAVGIEKVKEMYLSNGTAELYKLVEEIFGKQFDANGNVAKEIFKMNDTQELTFKDIAKNLAERGL